MSAGRGFLAGVAPVLCAALLAASPALGADQPPERAAVEALMKSYAQAWRARDVPAVIALYEPSAVIVNYVAGKIDPGALGKRLKEDLDSMASFSVEIEVQEFAVPGRGQALARVLMSMVGKRTSGMAVNRHDRYYLLLRKLPEGWRISKQSYRSDFGEAEGAPHHSVGTGAPAPALTPPTAPPGAP